MHIKNNTTWNYDLQIAQNISIEKDASQNPVTLTLNSKLSLLKGATLTVQPGNTLLIDYKGIITSDCGSDNALEGTIDVKPGATLILNGGSQILLKGKGNIIIESDYSGVGTLVYNHDQSEVYPDPVILLNDANQTVLELQGNLIVDENAIFTFSGNGYVKFNGVPLMLLLKGKIHGFL